MAPLAGQGRPAPREDRVCHRWVTGTPGRGACQAGGVRPAALVPRSAGSGQPSTLASWPGGRRLVYLPNKPGEGGTGPMGPPPCSDTCLGTASPRQPRSHVGVHGSLLPLLCQCRGPWARVPGLSSLLPPQPRGTEVPAGSHTPGSTGWEQQLCEQWCDPSSGHCPLGWAGLAVPGCGEVPGVQRWNAGAGAETLHCPDLDQE